MNKSVCAAFILAVGTLILPMARSAHAEPDAIKLKTKDPAPKLKVSKSIAFHTVTSVTTSGVTLTNSGAAQATISLGSPGPPFSITSPSKLSFTLGPGGSQNIAVQFAPTAAGKFKSEFTINCGDCTSASQDNIAVKLTGAAKGNVVPPPPPPPGGGGTSNALSFTVSGALDSVNEPFTSVTICATGTSNCTTVNNVLIDTASFGLRIFGSQLSGLGIQPTTNGGDEIGECALFGSGSTWGAVSTVDVVLAGEPKITIPIQVIDDTNAFATAPKSCTQGSQLMSSPSDARFNGLLGIGEEPNDGAFTLYYDCSGNDCSSISPPADVVIQPVTAFPVDNNGIVVSVPSIPASGEVNAPGTIYFGIGTESNNTPPSSVQTYLENTDMSDPADFLTIDTVFNGTTAPAFLDTGSNGYFFDDSNIPGCSGWYCPKSTLSLSATNESVGSSASGTVNFNVASAESLFETDNVAFDDLGAALDGGSSFDGFDWGMPFFFGRTVFVGIAGTKSSLGTGPYYAY
jgi:hypothetical protein